jgi:hypothetical protein
MDFAPLSDSQGITNLPAAGGTPSVLPVRRLAARKPLARPLRGASNFTNLGKSARCHRAIAPGIR